LFRLGQSRYRLFQAIRKQRAILLRCTVMPNDNDGLGSLTFLSRFEFVLKQRVMPMLAALDEAVDRRLPEQFHNDRDIDIASDVEDARDFHYAWAYVMLTTVVLGTLRSVWRFCNVPGAMRGGKVAKPMRGELGSIAKELAETREPGYHRIRGWSQRA
jgi:hypothetical protein